MSIYYKGMQPLDDDQHAAIAPLINRAARLGPYVWLAGIANGVAGLTVLTATDSIAMALFVNISAGYMLGRLSVDADRERVVEKWLEEATR